MNDLESFLNHLPSHAFFATQFYKKYQKALELYWHQQRKDALAFLTQEIAENIDHIDIHIFYRLWIEVLADNRDRPSLQLLKNHLANMAPNFEDYDQWASLRGLVHLELEELEACAMIVRSVRSNTFSPYAMELCQRYDLLFAQDLQIPLHILKCEAPITDFFVVQSLARGLLANSELSQLQKLVPKISRNYPKSPLQLHFDFWKNFDEDNLNQCVQIGERLCKRFPENEEFRFNLAYVRYCKNEIKNGIQTLEGLSTKIRARDPDVLALLGYGYLLKSQDKTQSADWAKAQKYFNLAQKHAKRLGLPTSELKLNLSYMQTKQNRKHSNDSALSTFWTIPLSARRENELMCAPEREVDHVFHSIPHKVHKDDYVYFVSSSNQSRIFALYRVTQTHVWHPYEKDQVLLELVHRFERSVELENAAEDQDLGIKRLDHEEANTWLSQLETIVPLRHKLKVPEEKPLRILRKIS